MPDNLLMPFVVVIVVGAIAWFAMGIVRRSQMQTPQRQLERMVGSEAADRLTRFERERDPSLPADQAARRAQERAEKDRGRKGTNASPRGCPGRVSRRRSSRRACR